MKGGHNNFSHIHAWWKCNALVSWPDGVPAWFGLKCARIWRDTWRGGTQISLIIMHGGSATHWSLTRWCTSMILVEMCKNLKTHMKSGHTNFSHIHAWWKCNALVSDQMVYQYDLGLNVQEFEEAHERGGVQNNFSHIHACMIGRATFQSQMQHFLKRVLKCQWSQRSQEHLSQEVEVQSMRMGTPTWSIIWVYRS